MHLNHMNKWDQEKRKRILLYIAYFFLALVLIQGIYKDGVWTVIRVTAPWIVLGYAFKLYRKNRRVRNEK